MQEQHIALYNITSGKLQILLNVSVNAIVLDVAVHTNCVILFTVSDYPLVMASENGEILDIFKIPDRFATPVSLWLKRTTLSGQTNARLIVQLRHKLQIK